MSRTYYLILAIVFAAEAPADPQTFRLDTSDWHDQPQSVHVAGDFNGWNSQADAMPKVGPQTYATTIDLEPGVHHYKLVIDGERWISDPRHSDAELEKPDGYGGVNSAVLVGPDARRLPPARSNHIEATVLTHRPSDTAHRSVVSAGTLLLGLTTRANDLTAVIAHVGNGQHFEAFPLIEEGQGLGLSRYVGLAEASNEASRYYFELRDGDAVLYLAAETGNSSTYDDEATAQQNAFIVDMLPAFVTPDWAKQAVWYQIFVERFRNGDSSNDPGDMPYENLLPWRSAWWDIHPASGEVPGKENFYNGAGNVWQRRYGGDLQGVRESLAYLRRLGVNAIYLNPIFEADSMHKYDTADFRHVDDNFGVKAADRFSQVPGETDDPSTWGWSDSDRVFLDLLREAHAQGFHVVIDGVFNHVGTSHPFFQDVLIHGKNSRYADWFEVTDWGDPDNWGNPESVGQPGGIQYNAWDKPSGALPVFCNDPGTGLAEGPRQHIFNITKRWMDPNGDGDPSDGIDGWRLDVPGDIAHPFWVEWRKLVKSINPDAYISGEIWSWAQPWLQGDQFDAVMNYQFAMPTLDFFADERTAIEPSDFAQRLQRVAYSYPLQVSLVQMNLFDSHDTDRVASMFVNPDRPYDDQNRLQDNGPDYNPAKPSEQQWQRLRQAIVCQMTFLGAPMIYYGTEAGMWGPDDPSDRMPMVWQELLPYEDPAIEFRQSLFDHYQRLIAIRHALPALQEGLFRTIVADDLSDTIVYERSLRDQHVYIAMNRSDQSVQIEFDVAPSDDNQDLIDLLDQEAVKVNVADSETTSILRPTLEPDDSFIPMRSVKGQLTLTLPPYGSAILTRSRSLTP